MYFCAPIEMKGKRRLTFSCKKIFVCEEQDAGKNKEIERRKAEDDQK